MMNFYDITIFINKRCLLGIRANMPIFAAFVGISGFAVYYATKKPVPNLAKKKVLRFCEFKFFPIIMQLLTLVYPDESMVKYLLQSLLSMPLMILNA